MHDAPRRLFSWALLLFILLPPGFGVLRAQPPLYRIGAPYPPPRDPRLTTDNGIPGTGSYYYRDYPYPSLREALQEYGLLGRRFRGRVVRGSGGGSEGGCSGSWPAQRARSGVGDEFDRLPLHLGAGAGR